jgi:hypothetical protein
LPSGGVDGSPHALPLSSLVQADKHPGLERYAPLPMMSFSSSRSRFLCNGKPSVLEVWQVGQEDKDSLAIQPSEQPGEYGLPCPIADMPKLTTSQIGQIGKMRGDDRIADQT